MEVVDRSVGFIGNVTTISSQSVLFLQCKGERPLGVCRYGIASFNDLVVFELVASLKASIRHVFSKSTDTYGQHYIIYRETYIVSRKTDLKEIAGCLLLLVEI